MTEPEFKNLWCKRTTIRLECPGGSVCLVTRPGPALALRIARLQRTLKPLLDASKVEDGATMEEAKAHALEAMNDEAERGALAFAREIVVATVVKPKLYLTPDLDDPAQIGVDDIDPRDFWYIFNWITNGARDVPVKLKGGEETTVEAVENFPEPQESSVGAGNHGGDVSEPEPEPALAD